MKSSTALDPAKNQSIHRTTNCFYCASDSVVPHYANIRDRLGHVKGEYGFLRCLTCGSLQLTPQPLASDVPSFYPETYSFRPDAVKGGLLPRLFATLENAMFYGPQYTAQTRKVLRGTKWDRRTHRSLLDIGCGPGLRLTQFRDIGFSVHGIDMQEEQVNFVKRQLGLPATTCDITEMATLLPPESYDTVTAFYLLEHIFDVRTFMKDCFSLIRPGGWLVVTVPVIDGLQASFFRERWIHVREAPRHLSLPTTLGLRICTEEAGFSEISIVGDSLLNCAGIIGGSLISGSDLTSTYGGSRGRTLALCKRVFGGLLSLASLPFAYYENEIAKRTSHAMMFARKPN